MASLTELVRKYEALKIDREAEDEWYNPYWDALIEMCEYYQSQQISEAEVKFQVAELEPFVVRQLFILICNNQLTNFGIESSVASRMLRLIQGQENKNIITQRI